MLSKVYKLRSRNRKPLGHLRILPSGKVVTTQNDIAESFSQYFASSLAPATINDPPQMENGNNPALSTASFDFKAIAGNLPNFKPGIRQRCGGIPPTAVVSCGPD